MNRGFSLLELSIVLVIIGLIAGGIVAGASMIRAAELRAVITEKEQFSTTVNVFRDKYLGVPGDLKNATAFWGAAHTTPATCLTTAGTGTQTCDGSGDGIIDSPAAASQYGEKFTFWQHLVNASLIKGTFTGIAGSSHNGDHEPNENIPESKLQSGIWTINNAGSILGASEAFDGQYGHTLGVGALAANERAKGNLLSPEEAWNIDTKLDDGMPATGTTVVGIRENCTNASSAVADSDNLDSVYELTDTTIQCSLLFKNIF